MTKDESPNARKGIKTDKGSGKIFLDISTIVNSTEEAMAMCKKHKQEAYSNPGTGEEVHAGAHDPIQKESEQKIMFILPRNPTDEELEEFVEAIMAQIPICP